MGELTNKEKCQKCGAQCCKFLTFRLPGIRNDRLKMEYYKTHGCRIEGDMVIIPSKCQHLQDDNSCGIYDKRPHYCRVFKGKSKTPKEDKRFYIPKECLL